METKKTDVKKESIGVIILPVLLLLFSAVSFLNDRARILCYISVLAEFENPHDFLIGTALSPAPPRAPIMDP